MRTQLAIILQFKYYSVALISCYLYGFLYLYELYNKTGVEIPLTIDLILFPAVASAFSTLGVGAAIIAELDGAIPDGRRPVDKAQLISRTMRFIAIGGFWRKVPPPHGIYAACNFCVYFYLIHTSLWLLSLTKAKMFLMPEWAPQFLQLPAQPVQPEEASFFFLKLSGILLLPIIVSAGTLIVMFFTRQVYTSKSKWHSYQPKLRQPYETRVPDGQGLKRVNYTKLHNLLAAGKWEEADRETTRRILQVIRKRWWENRWWTWWTVTKEDILSFPCADLRTINSLWLNHSNGKFGFSVQRDIWVSVGGNPSNSSYYDWNIYEKFAERVGWLKEGNWVNYSEMTFNINAPPGHLPVSYSLPLAAGDYFFSRAHTCNLDPQF